MQPFKRIRSLLQQMAALRAQGRTTEAAALAATYKSRGHGTGRFIGLGKHTVAQDKRAEQKRRNKK